MTSILHASVAIIGAGPVGLTLAALLSQHGVSVVVIEQNGGPTRRSKAIGIHSSTLESMGSLGLGADMVAAGRPLPDVRVWERGKILLETSFRRVPSRYSFVLALPQCETERLLLREFEAYGGCVRWNTSLVRVEDLGDVGVPTHPAQIVVSDKLGKESTIDADWIVGCDGGHSIVRQAADIDFPGGDYGRSFILGDVHLDWRGPKEDLQFFLSKNGYLLVIPLPSGMHRVIAQTNKRYSDFQGGQRQQVTLADLQAVVERNGPGNIIVSEPDWITAAPFYYRCADTPRKGRLVLAGDAFHLFSPLGAQGLNTGLGDAFNLAWKLAYIVRGLGPALRNPPIFHRSRYCADSLRFSTKRWNAWMRVDHGNCSIEKA